MNLIGGYRPKSTFKDLLDNSLLNLLNRSRKTWDCASTALKTNSNGTPKCTMFMESARSCEESVRSGFVTEAYNYFVCFVSAGRNSSL